MRYIEKSVLKYSLFSVKTHNKHGQQFLRTLLNKKCFCLVFPERTLQKCIIDNNIKGHFVILVLSLSLHKYCYSTTPVQGPENSGLQVPPKEILRQSINT